MGKVIQIMLICFAFICLAELSYAEIWDGLRIYRHDAPNVCAITFDDGPSRLTEQVLATLNKFNIRATFFVLGVQVEKYPNIVKKIIAAGHEVENHGYIHKNFHKISVEKQYISLNKTNILLEELGVIPKFFRPAYGKYTDETKILVKELGLSLFLWSSDSRDWRKVPIDYGNIDNILGRKFKFKETRGVFLFHDTVKNTVDNLPLIIIELYKSGCRKFVTVREYVEYSHETRGQLSEINLQNIEVWQLENDNDKAVQNKSYQPKDSESNLQNIEVWQLENDNTALDKEYKLEVPTNNSKLY